MKITIEFDQKESAAPSDTKQLIDSSKVTIPLDLNTSAIDDAQEKADKLKTSLIDIHELIQKVYYSRFLPDTSVIDDAQKKVDKLKTSFHEVQELILKNHSDTDQKELNTKPQSVGIESYSIPDDNQLNVKFIFLGKIMQPEDYQPFIDKLQLLCENFNRAS